MKGDISSIPCADQVRDVWDEKWSKHMNLCGQVKGQVRQHMHLCVPHKTGLSSWKYELWQFHIHIKKGFTLLHSRINVHFKTWKAAEIGIAAVSSIKYWHQKRGKLSHPLDQYRLLQRVHVLQKQALCCIILYRSQRSCSCKKKRTF